MLTLWFDAEEYCFMIVLNCLFRRNYKCTFDHIITIAFKNAVNLKKKLIINISLTHWFIFCFSVVPSETPCICQSISKSILPPSSINWNEKIKCIISPCEIIYLNAVNIGINFTIFNFFLLSSTSNNQFLFS